METAYAEQRILLTEDKDFGWLTFVAHAESVGVILIRFPAGARSTLAASVSELIAQYAAELNGAFVALRPGSVRISRSAVSE